LEVGLGSCRQEGEPSRFKARTRGFERRAGAATAFARIGARVKAKPLLAMRIFSVVAARSTVFIGQAQHCLNG
jgi:hypothetical protein